MADVRGTPWLIYTDDESLTSHFGLCHSTLLDGHRAVAADIQFGSISMSSLNSKLFRLSGYGLVVFVLNATFGVLGISYLRTVPNNPFELPAEVSAIHDDRIELADGRVVKFDGEVAEELREQIRESEGNIGLEFTDEDRVNLYVRRIRTNCQLGRPMFVIPLRPFEMPRYGQRWVGYGQISSRE